jgi:hypothetical protein
MNAAVRISAAGQRLSHRFVTAPNQAAPATGFIAIF